LQTRESDTWFDEDEIAFWRAEREESGMSNGNGSQPADPRMLRRVVVGATVGTALEWYDFFIYGTAAALVFGDLFFSDAVPGAGTLIAFATFGVGFVARPFGGMIMEEVDPVQDEIVAATPAEPRELAMYR
jgi:hypothetical protein